MGPLRADLLLMRIDPRPQFAVLEIGDDGLDEEATDEDAAGAILRVADEAAEFGGDLGVFTVLEARGFFGEGLHCRDVEMVPVATVIPDLESLLPTGGAEKVWRFSVDINQAMGVEWGDEEEGP